MRRALLLSALVAWLMFQVPMVLCHSACGQSQEALFLMEGHSCHQEESEAHQVQCVHHDAEDDAEDDGEHVLVTIESSTASSSVGLPAPECSNAVCAGPAAELESIRPSVTQGYVWGDLSPPPDRDPVSAADRLLV